MAESAQRRRAYLSSIILSLAGLGLLPGGVELLTLGGSPYYVTEGVALVLAGVLLVSRSRWGWRIYIASLLATVAWALWECGLSFWPLAPRILPLAALGLVFLLPAARAVSFDPPTPTARKALWGVAGIGVAAVIVALLVAIAPPKAPAGNAPRAVAAETDWPFYGNTQGGSRYANIAQINATNVGDLEVAWTYRSGDFAYPDENPPIIFSFEATPIKIGGMLYLCTAHNIVLAVDAQSGKEVWRFDPKVDTKGRMNAMACRGVAYAAPVDAAATACPRRIYAGAMDGRLFALNADTGKPCQDFGRGGTVSLLEHLGDFPRLNHYITSVPVVIGNNVVTGALVTDSQPYDVGSGVIRSYDAVTGKIRWAWDMGAPDRIGPPPEGEIYTPNTPNAWAQLSVDEKLGLVYVPLGNPSPDYFGGNRRPFDELYGSSVVALDANDGRPRWHFQTVHHDVWDYDLPSQPTLVDLPRPALIQATKPGQVFVLDRRDGTPILPVTEKPVPQNPEPHEHLSPTQPFSAINLQPPVLKESDMWGITPYDQLACRILFKKLRYDGPYTPHSTHGTLQYPGLMGVTEWGGVAVDEQNKVMVVNTSTVPYWPRLLAKEDMKDVPSMHGTFSMSAKAEPDEKPRNGFAVFWANMQGPYFASVDAMLGPMKAPCNQPPWGHMVAYDLTTGKQLWRREIGTARDSGPFFQPIGLALPIGTPNLGGPLVTAGGLVFHAGTLDNYLRAYDVKTGKELWRTRLPAGGQATPMTYVAADGRQYVVIAAGGHGGLRTTPGDYLIAYALPK